MFPFLGNLLSSVGTGIGGLLGGLGGAGGNIPPGMVLGPNGLVPAPPQAASPTFLDTNQGAGVGFDPASGGQIGFQMQRPTAGATPPHPMPRPMQGADGMAAPAAPPTPQARPMPGLSRNPYETQMRSAGEQAQEEEGQKVQMMQQQIMQQGGPKNLSEYLIMRNQFGIGK